MRILSSVVLTALVVAVVLPIAAAAQDDRPNIVFILVDDLRWDDIGAAGHPFVETPHIDLMGMDELYNLEADPYELENLIDRGASAALLEVLQTELSRLLAATQ